MKNFKRIFGLVTVLVAVGILSMMAFAEVDEVVTDVEEPAAVVEVQADVEEPAAVAEIQADVEEPVAVAEIEADIVEADAEVTVTDDEEAFVCTGECTGECEGEGPIQARDGSGTGLQKRLGGGEGNANGEGKGLGNGEGLANGSGYRGGRNS